MRSCLLAILCLGYACQSAGAQFNVLHTFEKGETLAGKPLVVGSTIYGTTFEGSLFRIGIDGSGYEVLHTFDDSDPSNFGYEPSGQLAFDGTRIYGTTSSGGLQNQGTVYAFNPVSREIQTLGSNSQGANSIIGLGPALSGSTLYGSTGLYAGGDTIYRLNTDGSNFETAHTFDYAAEGRFPNNLMVASGTIYGTTTSSQQGGGAVFSFSDEQGLQVLHEFAGLDGKSPKLAPLFIEGSTIYGTTERGGAFGGSNGYGTVFRMNVDGTGFETLHDFAAVEGITPRGVVLIGSQLVGITVNAGPGQGGTLFALNTDGSNFQILHAFSPFSDSTVESLGLSVSGNTAYGFRTDLSHATPSVLFSIAVPEPSSFSIAAAAMLPLLLAWRRVRRSKSRLKKRAVCDQPGIRDERRLN